MSSSKSFHSFGAVESTRAMSAASETKMPSMYSHSSRAENPRRVRAACVTGRLFRRQRFQPDGERGGDPEVTHASLRRKPAHELIQQRGDHRRLRAGMQPQDVPRPLLVVDCPRCSPHDGRAIEGDDRREVDEGVPPRPLHRRGNYEAWTRDGRRRRASLESTVPIASCTGSIPRWRTH